MGNSHSDRWDDRQKEEPENSSESKNSFPATDLISLESLINVLIHNGICTADELFKEEQSRRLYLESAKDISLVKTDDSEQSRNSSTAKRNRSWLRRKMSKRKWTRSLGSSLFGWEWRKVRNNKRALTVESPKK